MKIAVAGKGGTGKTLVAACLAKLFRGAGRQVYAFDADPGGGLGAALGLTKETLGELRPIIGMREFIDTGRGDGALYLSDPNAGGVSGKFSVDADGVCFLKMTDIKPSAGIPPDVAPTNRDPNEDGPSAYILGADGPSAYILGADGPSAYILGADGPSAAGLYADIGYCDEHSFLRALLGSMLIDDRDVVILDMSAGVEPLTRGTVRGVDLLLIVTEATRACVDATKDIRALAAGLGVGRVTVAANKIRSEKEEILIRASFHRDELAGLIHFSDAVADLAIGIGAGAKDSPADAAARLPGVAALFENLIS